MSPHLEVQDSVPVFQEEEREELLRPSPLRPLFKLNRPRRHHLVRRWGRCNKGNRWFHSSNRSRCCIPPPQEGTCSIRPRLPLPPLQAQTRTLTSPLPLNRPLVPPRLRRSKRRKNRTLSISHLRTLSTTTDLRPPCSLRPRLGTRCSIKIGVR